MKKRMLQHLPISIGYSNAVFFALDANGIRLSKIRHTTTWGRRTLD